MVLNERDLDEHLNVASGNAVLAGIAASDSICCMRLSRMQRGSDHNGAADLLASAIPDGQKVSQIFMRLLSLKDEAHYGVMKTSSRKARDSVKWASNLIKRAQEEIER
jgi:anaerobic glycerol-3-phosphate dehydrogenase